MICTPASLSQEVGLALGAQAGELRLREVITGGGFTRFRRATETPFNLVLEARPVTEQLQQKDMTKMATLTVPALRRAIETRDGATLAAFYADDAVLRIVDQMNPPSRPSEIKGRDAIAAYYADVCGRTMTHRVDTAVC